jgi:HEAT repeat protein
LAALLIACLTLGCVGKRQHPDDPLAERKQKIKHFLDRMNSADQPCDKCYAAAALGELGRVEALQPLLDCLACGKLKMEAAAIGLGKLGDRRAFPSLLDRLNCDHYFGSYEIVTALGDLGDLRAVQPLIDCLSAKHSNSAISTSAAEALGKLGDPKAIEPLTGLLPPVRYYSFGHYAAYAKALQALGWEPEQEEERIYFWLGGRDVTSLLQNRERVASLLISDLNCTDSQKREAAVDHLMWLGFGEAVDPLVDFLFRYGDLGRAQDFLDSGQPELEAAARKWARIHSVPIVPKSNLIGSSPKEWGSWR